MNVPCLWTEDIANLGGVAGEPKGSKYLMQSDNPFSKKLQALKGSMGPPNANVQGTPAMPKMGVRARVSDWPQRKDGWESQPPPRYDSLVPTFQNGPSKLTTEAILQKSQELLNAEFPETRYPLCDLLSHSPMKGFPGIKRSNSEVTISDICAEDLDHTTINPNTGATLRREYGSTSSLDKQGLSGSSEGFVGNLRGYHVEDRSDQPSAPPPQSFPELLRLNTTLSPSLQTAAQIARGDIVCIPGYDYVDSSLLYSRERERSFIQRMKAEKADTSIFRRLRNVKSEGEYLDQEDGGRFGRPLSFQKCFAHYDVQSVLFNISEAVANRADLGRRKNTTTGASAASQCQALASGLGDSATHMPICESPEGSCEELGHKASMDTDEGDGKSNTLVLSCPYFRNETGGEGERKVALSKASSASYGSGDYAPNYGGGGQGYSVESSLSTRCTNAGVSVLEVPRESQAFHRDMYKRYIIEHIDQGAYYYHKYFYNKDHQNYFGTDENLGPVAVSIRREKLDEGKEGAQYNYRVTFRTSELTTLRGAILEDAVPSTAKHGMARGLPLKEVLEYVVPELNIQCLRLATSSPKVPEQLLKLDQQGLSFQHKVGIMYCQAGQSTEEEMYNNESASPALEEFMELLGQKVRLKGFTKYRAQLDNKTDSTGTHSLYTTYKDFELMFHVSTLLPYTPNNRQQLLRKRHIGNDIVTVIFQEPGALPFTPKNIRSHFQHVFIIVKVQNPCTENVCYSVAVTRSKDVPAFGPPIPQGVLFPKSAMFRDFLLAKMLNGENAVHKSDKFRAMAMRTRQEYLKDLAENFVSATPVDSSAAKFSFISLGVKKKERSRPRRNAHLQSYGAVTWAVVARDFGQSADIGCLLAVSNEFVVLIEEASKEVVFNCYCRDVLGWSATSGSVRLFYERGECVVFSTQEGCWDDIREIMQRLEIVTRGCETVEMTLRRNGLGQLGFHVNFEGVVADVEPFGFAWQVGLRPGSRLMEICKVAVATLSHEQMIDLLRTSNTVSVVIVQPHEDGTPRRSCSEMYRIPVVEYKTTTAAGWHRVSAAPGGGLPLSRTSPTQGPSPGQQMFHYAQGAISRSTSFDKKQQDGTRVLQEYEISPTASCSSREAGQLYCSSPSNQSTSSDPGPCGTWSQKAGYINGCQSPALLLDQPSDKEGEGRREREPKLERTRSAEAKWHHPSTKILNVRERSQPRQGAKDSPNKYQHSGSSHSSSNTLSSNASSGSSDDKDPMDPDALGLIYIKGASTDSGIDTAPCMPPPPPPLPGCSRGGVPGVSAGRPVPQDARGEQWVLEYPRTGAPEGGLTSQGYSTQATSAGHVTDGSLGDLSEISSMSSGSRHSGSPSERVPKTSTSVDSSKVYTVVSGGTATGAGLNGPVHARQSPGEEYLIGWKKAEDGSPMEDPGRPKDYGGVEGVLSYLLKTLTLRSRLRAMLVADGQLQKVQPSLTREAFLKMMLPDSPPGEGGRGKSLTGPGGLPMSPRRSLYRTLSDESLCSSHRKSLVSSRSSLLDQALPNDILFSTAAGPYHSTLPPRMNLGHSHGAPLHKNELWFSDSSLADRCKMADGSLMPLPEAVSGLDWSHLVDAARAFEGLELDKDASRLCDKDSQKDSLADQGSLCSMLDVEQAQQAMELSHELSRRVAASEAAILEAGDGSPALLTGKVIQLEEILRQLQFDLRKEQEDKAMLQEQVQHLRQDNMRLHEESQTAAAQLRRFSEWFLHSVDNKKP
ncbi:signal-induced proliferation-associated 1-like protein 2 isoform X2 [Coregonus clupeaformis]|uniref:signal-induced proliferation-associated 1-like protein 2 isoform X2 n=1 Tax=Coregonus clupeaformis TaxID=59861 RepID=UPI001E1C8160|nr:signal-induced proliferation-associated 1-like protein 2 isoform X2 [Coregonus clupeaformis]